MKPTSPVLRGFEEHEVVLAENQPEYIPLPVLYLSGPERRILSRWKFTDEERIEIASGGDLLLSQLTFGQLFQPVCLEIVDAA